MKKITLLLATMFAVVCSAMADVPATGTKGYLYNPATTKLIAASAKLDDVGIEFNLTNEKTAKTHDSYKNGDADCNDGFTTDRTVDNVKTYYDFKDPGHTYTYARFDNSGNYLKVNPTMQLGSGTGYSKWAVLETEKGWLIRMIYVYDQIKADGVNQGDYLTANEDGTLVMSAEPSETSYWQFLNETEWEKLPAVIEYKKKLAEEAEAEAKATKDALAAMNDGAGVKVGDELLATLFPNAGFDASNDATGWTVTWKDGNKPSYAVANGNCGMTKYQGTIKMEKTIKGLPAGMYTLKAQAFARKGNNASNIQKYEAGEDLGTPGVIFANNVTKPVKNIVEGPVSTKGDVDPSKFTDITIDGETMYILNNSASGSYVFSLGQYELELNVSIGEGEDLTFGFDKNTANTDDYCGCDNFRLIYLGEDPATGISAVSKKVPAKTIFNAAGQQLKSLQKGLNIVDGKKIMVK